MTAENDHPIGPLILPNADDFAIFAPHEKCIDFMALAVVRSLHTIPYPRSSRWPQLLTSTFGLICWPHFGAPTVDLIFWPQILTPIFSLIFLTCISPSRRIVAAVRLSWATSLRQKVTVLPRHHRGILCPWISRADLLPAQRL